MPLSYRQGKETNPAFLLLIPQFYSQQLSILPPPFWPQHPCVERDSRVPGQWHRAQIRGGFGASFPPAPTCSGKVPPSLSSHAEAMPWGQCCQLSYVTCLPFMSHYPLSPVQNNNKPAHLTPIIHTTHWVLSFLPLIFHTYISWKRMGMQKCKGPI